MTDRPLEVHGWAVKIGGHTLRPDTFTASPTIAHAHADNWKAVVKEGVKVEVVKVVIRECEEVGDG